MVEGPATGPLPKAEEDGAEFVLAAISPEPPRKAG